MRRREFITLLGGAAMASAWSWPAGAQQPGSMRRVSWLGGGAEDDPFQQANVRAFHEGLAKLGWIEGRNLRIDLRFGAGNSDRIRALAAELAGLAPAVIVTNTGLATRALQQQTRTIPIIFTAGGDPTVTDRVLNIARPEGNTTGFSAYEPSIAGKWIELLKEAAPGVTRAAILINPELSLEAGPSYIAAVKAAAPPLGIQATEMPVRNAVDIVRAFDTFAREPNGSLIVLPPPATSAIRETIFQLATQYRLPATYPSLEDIAAGGLLAYAHDRVDAVRRAATYVDRILRGAKVSELPVQFPSKFELVINLKTAKAIGLEIPSLLLARADAVIE